MPRLLLVAAVLVLVLYAGPAVLRASRRLNRATRKRLARNGLMVLGAVAVVLLFARFGFHWLGVAGAAVLAGLRWIVPLAVRLLPFAARFRGERAGTRGSRGSAEGGPPGAGSTHGHRSMARSEALQILGLEEGATRQQVLGAYRNLIRKVHPDHPGGSQYLASKLNQAKDVLLG